MLLLPTPACCEDASEGRIVAATSKMADAGTFGLTCRNAEAALLALTCWATKAGQVTSRESWPIHESVGRVYGRGGCLPNDSTGASRQGGVAAIARIATDNSSAGPNGNYTLKKMRIPAH